MEKGILNGNILSPWLYPENFKNQLRYKHFISLFVTLCSGWILLFYHQQIIMQDFDLITVCHTLCITVSTE